MGTASITIVYDCRERKPLPIPRRLTDWLDPRDPPSSTTFRPVNITIAKRTLPVADYIIETGEARSILLNEEYPTRSGVVETKRSLSEIAANVLGNPRKRNNFALMLHRMTTKFHYPLLVVEGGLTTLYTPDRNCPPPGPTTDAFQRILMRHRVSLLLVPERSNAQRRHTADFVVRWLLNGALINGDLQWE